MRPEYRVADVSDLHPWTLDPGYVVEVWETLSHEESKRLADYAIEDGWQIWHIANEGTPSLVVYREDPDSAKK